MHGIKIGLIGGSGLGEAVLRQTQGTRHEVDTPFGPPSDAILETEWDGAPVFFLSRHGPGHVYGPSQVPFRANLFALKKLGCTHIIASGAVGSLREEFKPRDLVIPDQIIDKTYKRAGTFYERAAVHVEFSEPFCPVLRQMLVEAGGEVGGQRSEVRGQKIAKGDPVRSGSRTDPSQSAYSPDLRPLPSDLSFRVHPRGCYVCMEGPAFSSRAESLMHRLWGGDLIGMTAMPEAKLAREAEISYALVALVTDYDSWRRPASMNAGPGLRTPVAGGGGKPPADPPPADPFVLLQEIIANLQAASDNAIQLIRRTVGRVAEQGAQVPPAPAYEALKLAIWSDKARIPPDEVERLGPLWMKYFSGGEKTRETVPEAAGVETAGAEEGGVKGEEAESQEVGSQEAGSENVEMQDAPSQTIRSDDVAIEDVTEEAEASTEPDDAKA